MFHNLEKSGSSTLDDLTQSHQEAFFGKHRLPALVLSLIPSLAMAQSDGLLFFDPSWCPRPEELAEIDRYAYTRMNGCCIRQAIAHKEFRSTSAWSKWAHRLADSNAFDAECTGRVLSAEEAALADAEHARRVEEERARREQELQAEEARKRRGAPELLRSLSREDFCVAFGTAIRSNTIPEVGTFPELPGLAKAEARRRSLAIDAAQVAKEQIRIGISECQLLASWGQPEQRNRTVGRWGTHTQYVYGDRLYVYTENGKVTSWQD